MKNTTRARRRTVSAAMVAVAMGASVLTASAAGTASAASAVTVTRDGGLAVDAPLGRVFVGDEANNSVEAADTSGNLIGTVPGITGVTSLAVSDDGSTVYAAAFGGNEIVAIDAKTLTVTARYVVPTTKGPQYVAFSGGKVWFTYGDQWDSNLGSVDPAKDPSDPTAVTMGQFTDPYPNQGFWNPALMSTNPAEPGVIAMADSGMSTDSEGVLDVSSGTPKVVAFHFGDYSLNNGIDDIQLVPGGTQVLINGTNRDAYANGKFTPDGSYPQGQSAAVAPDGTVAQVAGGEISVYRPAASVPLRSYAASPVTPSLAWAPDESRIYALEGQEGGPFTLRVLTDPTKTVPTLTASAPSSATRGKALTVKGKLSAATALPAGTRLAVTRTDLDSPQGKALAPVTVNSDGTYSFTDTPPAGGTVTYTVSYAGSGALAAVSTSAKVAVSRTTPSLTLNDNNQQYGYGTTVTFTAHLGSEYKNKVVQIWANPYGGDKPNTELKSGTVNSSGNLSVSLRLTRNTTLSAVYAGDDRTAPRTVTSTVYTRVWESGSLSGQYRNAKIGSTEYAWFHKNSDAVFNTTMMYYPGRKERVDFQVYSGGSWRTTNSQYFALPPSGDAKINLGAAGQANIKARIRVVYVQGSSGDDVNATNNGAWQYLNITN
ncbi:hypothetical protein [Streptomyces sp. ICBB 8177]|uniref:YncE family protein n=1 Tax=Streptomyces sp. ICBB 8177 TaxID=563922 RepID=UPI000D681ADA|nr:hypothetical protein [Streptomyces sp. ICBB 8177]PWI41076.1 hypothetical protein CK485_27305 [Streptomyces sp. ICBB 8177]